MRTFDDYSSESVGEQVIHVVQRKMLRSNVGTPRAVNWDETGGKVLEDWVSLALLKSKLTARFFC